MNQLETLILNLLYEIQNVKDIKILDIQVVGKYMRVRYSAHCIITDTDYSDTRVFTLTEVC